MRPFSFSFVFCLLLFSLPFKLQADCKPPHALRYTKEISGKEIHTKGPTKEFIPIPQRGRKIVEQFQTPITKKLNSEMPSRQIIEVGGKERKDKEFVPLPHRKKFNHGNQQRVIKPINTPKSKKMDNKNIENKKDKLAVTEVVNSIREKLSKCWVIPEGIAYKENFNIKINLLLSNQGEIIMADIADNNSYRNNMLFRSIADSAMRAIYKCSPLTGLPSEHHDIWSEVTLDFILTP